jgi:predicted nucleic acid-binding Zn ribbon protein
MPKPHKLADVLSELFTKRGYARVQAGEAMQTAWRAAAGELEAAHCKVGNMRGGVLHVFVANSTLLHELTFRKADLLASLSRSLPELRLRDLRFRLAALPAPIGKASFG